MEENNKEEYKIYIEYGQKDIKDIISELLEKNLEEDKLEVKNSAK